MPTAIIDGISTRYEVIGSGPPLLMFAPAGFDASMEKWRTTGVYTRIKPLDHLPKKYSCILFNWKSCRRWMSLVLPNASVYVLSLIHI